LYSVGNTFGVPDSVMGLTLLAAGGCLTEAFSSIILARKGESWTGICSNKKIPEYYNMYVLLFNYFCYNSKQWFITCLYNRVLIT
jgi:Ca2+/Na+ antiporter